MRAAPRGERKGPARGPSASSRHSIQSEAGRPPAARAVSKLHAGRRLGFPRRAASLAATMILVLVGVVVLATGGRGTWLANSAVAIAHAPLGGLGLTVREVHLQGVSPAAQDEGLRRHRGRARDADPGRRPRRRPCAGRAGRLGPERPGHPALSRYPGRRGDGATADGGVAAWRTHGRGDQQRRGRRSGRSPPVRQAAADRGRRCGRGGSALHRASSGASPGCGRARLPWCASICGGGTCG